MTTRPLPLLGLMALATTAAALLVSCVPVEHLDASPVAGRVVDRATGRPIASAQVVLSVSFPDREARTQTDQDGRFQLPGFRHVEFTPLPYGMYRAPTGYLRIETTGYQPYVRGEFFDTDDGPGYSHRNVLGNLLQVHIALARQGSR